MTCFVDLDRSGRAAYFNGHGQALVDARDKFIAAVGAYYDVLKAQSAFDGLPPTRDAFITNQIESAHNRVAEEVSDYLAW